MYFFYIYIKTVVVVPPANLGLKVSPIGLFFFLKVPISFLFVGTKAGSDQVPLQEPGKVNPNLIAA